MCPTGVGASVYTAEAQVTQYQVPSNLTLMLGHAWNEVRELQPHPTDPKAM